MTKVQSFLRISREYNFFVAAKFAFDKIIFKDKASLKLKALSLDFDKNMKTEHYRIPLPPSQLRTAVSGSDVGGFYQIGESWAQVISHLIKDNDTILDIGCGCGKTARLLLLNPNIEYIGFDICKPLIEWSKIYIESPTKGPFQFRHFDVASEVYNPLGQLNGNNVQFPIDSDSIDFSFAASLFTHIFEDVCINYLKETQRVLKKGGKALYSIHINPREGTTYSGNESRIDIAPEYFIKLAGDFGLKLVEDIGKICGQNAFLFEKE